MPNALIFASQGRDQDCFTDALRRLRLPKRWRKFVRKNNIRTVRSPDDIHTSDEEGVAVVEIFDHEKAAIDVMHPVTDQLPGILALRLIQQRLPNYAVLAISHSTCVNGSKYVESQLLADHVIAIDWTENSGIEKGLKPVDLVMIGLRNAIEHRPHLAEVRSGVTASGGKEACPSEEVPAA